MICIDSSRPVYIPRYSDQ